MFNFSYNFRLLTFILLFLNITGIAFSAYRNNLDSSSFLSDNKLSKSRYVKINDIFKSLSLTLANKLFPKNINKRDKVEYFIKDVLLNEFSIDDQERILSDVENGENLEAITDDVIMIIAKNATSNIDSLKNLEYESDLSYLEYYKEMYDKNFSEDDLICLANKCIKQDEEDLEILCDIYKILNKSSLYYENIKIKIQDVLSLFKKGAAWENLKTVSCKIAANTRNTLMVLSGALLGWSLYSTIFEHAVMGSTYVYYSGGVFIATTIAKPVANITLFITRPLIRKIGSWFN